MALDHTNVTNLADHALSGVANGQADSNKSDLRATIAIKLFADRMFAIWHSFLPDTMPEKLQSDDTRQNPDMWFRRHSLTDNNVLTITNPADALFWMETGSFIHPIAVKLDYFCSTNCAPIPYTGDGLIEFDF